MQPLKRCKQICQKLQWYLIPYLRCYIIEKVNGLRWWKLQTVTAAVCVANRQYDQEYKEQPNDRYGG